MPAETATSVWRLLTGAAGVINMLSGILGRKVGMTQLFGPNGTALPATVIQAGPVTVTQVKTAPTDGYEAVQIGFDPTKRATRPILGHLGHNLPVTPSQRRRQQQQSSKERQKAREARAEAGAKAEATAADETEADETATQTEADEAEARGTATTQAGKGKGADKASRRGRRGRGQALGPFRVLREVRVLDGAPVKIGEVVNVGIFRIGEEVDVIGTSKGKGFAGVMKRHGFRGGPRTHGQSDRARAPGSIGPGTTPGRVLKGTRMAGRMGNERVTVKHLEVLQADPDRNLLVLRGSVPGPNGGLIMVRKIAGQTALMEHLHVERALEAPHETPQG
jgi:large subunit ribosomal protein L3